MYPPALLRSTMERGWLSKRRESARARRRKRRSKRPSSWPIQMERWNIKKINFNLDLSCLKVSSLWWWHINNRVIDLKLSCLKLTLLAGTCGDGAPSRGSHPQGEIRKELYNFHNSLLEFSFFKIKIKIIRLQKEDLRLNRKHLFGDFKHVRIYS